MLLRNLLQVYLLLQDLHHLQPMVVSLVEELCQLRQAAVSSEIKQLRVEGPYLGQIKPLHSSHRVVANHSHKLNQHLEGLVLLKLKVPHYSEGSQQQLREICSEVAHTQLIALLVLAPTR
jgi:hypothetical protein